MRCGCLNCKVILGECVRVHSTQTYCSDVGLQEGWMESESKEK